MRFFSLILILPGIFSAGQAIDITESSPRFELHKAVRDKNIELVKKLIDNGADVNEKDTRYWTPLHWAADAGSMQIAKLLIAKGAKIIVNDIYGLHPLKIAEIRGHQNLANVLMVGTQNDISAAAVLGDINRVKTLLEEDPNRVNQKSTGDFTPLHSAVRAGHIQVVELLIDKGADINAKTIFRMTPLQFAASQGYKDILELLVAKGARMDIYAASAIGDIERVKTFLTSNPDLINAPQEWDKGYTPLHWAAYCGHTELVKVLIDKGANVNSAECGVTPLYWAVRYNNVPTVKLLFAEGAELNTDEKLKVSLLGYCVHLGFKDMAELLISNSADINAQLADIPMLHMAIMSRNVEMVEFLLAKGADTNAKDKNGRTALELAEEIDCKPLANLLRK
jgi:ankyrin repeat protein